MNEKLRYTGRRSSTTKVTWDICRAAEQALKGHTSALTTDHSLTQLWSQEIMSEHPFNEGQNHLKLLDTDTRLKS